MPVGHVRKVLVKRGIAVFIADASRDPSVMIERPGGFDRLLVNLKAQ